MNNPEKNKNPVCENCGRDRIPNGCDGCLAALAFEVGTEIEEKELKQKEARRRREASYIGVAFRDKYQRYNFRKFRWNKNPW